MALIQGLNLAVRFLLELALPAAALLNRLLMEWWSRQP